MQKLYLIDGTALIFRSYFAFIRTPLYNSKGMNTGAILGTVNIFLKLLDKFEPDHIAISFDRKGKTFRNELDENYKANRPPAPDELVEQIEPIKRFFELIGLKEISCEGYEADDVLATLAEQYKNDYEVIIVSGDKDFAQLVDDNVKLYDPSKDMMYDREAVQEKYGLTPEQFIDYLAIVGDTADNIPGIKGVGPKGAEKLLGEYGNLETIYDNVENIKAKGMRNKVAESKESAFMSRTLATIIRDVDVSTNVDNLKFSREHMSAAIPHLTEFEISSVVKRLTPKTTAPKVTAPPVAKPKPTSAKPKKDDHSDEFDFGLDDNETSTDTFYETELEVTTEFEAILIDSNEKFEAMLKDISRFEVLAIDTETTSLDPLLADLVGISICGEEAKAYYISIAHQMADNVELKYALDNLEKALAGKTLIAHNVKYDYMIFKHQGWTIENELFDTMIADYLVNPTLRHSLDSCSQREFGYAMKPIKELIGSGKKQITFDLVPADEASFYAAEDAWITFKLHKIMADKLLKSGLYQLFSQLEMPLFKVLAQIEENGVYIDAQLLSVISKRNQKRMAEITERIYEIAGYQFNLNSTKQLGKLLFEDLGIPAVKKTKTGYSTDVSVLEKLAMDHEIARKMLDYRQITKLESTYVSALPLLINPKTGRVHSSFNQTVASTGRLSSNNPNLQNIPIRSEMGKEIRTAFCAKDEDHIIVAADYSQIELRLLAILSNDESLVTAFQNKMDIHSQTASIIYEVPIKEVTSDQRRYAKIINFGLLYGMGPFRISNELNISRKEAAEFIENYFNKFPTIKDYIQTSIESATKKGYAETIMGRKLYLPELNSSNKMRIAEAQRIATNMPIQGSAADIIKLAMINLHEKLKDEEGITMMIQVHDELVFEVHKDRLDFAKELITTEMENALPEDFPSQVPLVVDVGIGKNWFEAH